MSLGKFYRVGPTGVPKVSEIMDEKVSAEHCVRIRMARLENVYGVSLRVDSEVL